ncbi:sialoadhesin-like [Sinocyclocheilus grahami]|uniref:sialoadhesin-like n=1 Tax=Sinocyclocheilus grahami TaxID=75366 RepID=UPI0007AD4426|nr:PREDICTED: sialoadhesin-like [Sinocyclocheilus grahami]
MGDATKIIKYVSVSAGGRYWCRAQRGEYYSEYSSAVEITVRVRPKPVVHVHPDENVFRGETVTLTCDIQETVYWSYGGVYSCGGVQSRDPQYSQMSDGVTLTVSDKLQPTLTVNPQSSVFTGDTVTLSYEERPKPVVTVTPDQRVFRGETVTLTCDIQGGGNFQWTYSWFKDASVIRHVTERVYTITSVSDNSGEYSCRGERSDSQRSDTSAAVTLTVSGVSPSVSLVVSPSRSQHFSSDSLSLSCEDQSNSTGWTVRRYTDRNTEDCSKLTGSTCQIVSLNTSDAGVYWCQSESGEKRHPLNITVHDGDVILLSSVDPVIEGDTLTLHCLHRSTNSSILRADFYKDGSLVQNQTTGEMNITTVSKSHEGLYYCKTERGQSLHSWISVRAASSSLLVTGVVVGLSVCLLFFLSLLLMWRYKKNKDQQRNINQTSVPNQSAQSQLENYPLQSAGSDHIYDDVTEVNKRDRDDPEPSAEVTYSEVTVKKKMDKGNTKAESNNVTYSEVRTKGKKCKSKDINTAGPSDLTYAQINVCIDLSIRCKQTASKHNCLNDYSDFIISGK